MKRRNLLTVLLLVLLISIYLVQAQTSPYLTEFKTVVVLGSHIPNTREVRVSGAFDLIKAGNFEKVIFTGGCTWPSDASKNKEDKCTNEANAMEEILLNLVKANGIFNSGGFDASGKVINQFNINGKTVSIYKENKSGSTNENYKFVKAMNLIAPNDKVLVVSSADHVKAVTYCFKYADQADAYYYLVEKTITFSEALSLEFSTVRADYNEGDYKSLVNSCRPAGAASSTFIPGSGTGSTYPQPQIASTAGCANPLRCREIDEVWGTRVGTLVRSSNQVWDHTLYVWVDYVTATAYNPAATITLGGGGVTSGTVSQAGGTNAYDEIIKKAAAKAQIAPALVKAVMDAESEFNPNDVSEGDYVGLMQIRATEENDYINIQCNQKPESTGKKLCDVSDLNKRDSEYRLPVCSSSGLNCKEDERYNVEKNIFFGAMHLRDKQQKIGMGGVTNPTECQIKAIVTAYNLGQKYVNNAINLNNNLCDSWSNVWQKIYENTKCNGQLCQPTTKCPNMQGTVFGENKDYDVCGKIFRKNGIKDQGESGDYVLKMYTKYLIYKSSELSTGSTSSGTSTSSSSSANLAGSSASAPFCYTAGCDETWRIRKIDDFYAGSMPTKSGSGNCDLAKGKQFLQGLKSLGVTTIIDLNCECGPSYPALVTELGMNRIAACIGENGPTFSDGIWEVVKNKLSNGNAYLHCTYGKHRTTAVIEKWLIEAKGKGCKEALDKSKQGSSANGDALAKNGYFNNYGSGIILDSSYKASGTHSCSASDKSYCNYHTWVLTSSQCQTEGLSP